MPQRAAVKADLAFTFEVWLCAIRDPLRPSAPIPIPQTVSRELVEVVGIPTVRSGVLPTHKKIMPCDASVALRSAVMGRRLVVVVGGD
jgi:hypothetical protein